MGLDYSACHRIFVYLFCIIIHVTNGSWEGLNKELPGDSSGEERAVMEESKVTWQSLM